VSTTRTTGITSTTGTTDAGTEHLTNTTSEIAATPPASTQHDIPGLSEASSPTGTTTVTTTGTTTGTTTDTAAAAPAPEHVNPAPDHRLRWPESLAITIALLLGGAVAAGAFHPMLPWLG